MFLLLVWETVLLYLLMGRHLMGRLPAERLRRRSGRTRVFARDKPVTSPPGSRPGTHPRAGSAIESALRARRCRNPGENRAEHGGDEKKGRKQRLGEASRQQAAREMMRIRGERRRGNFLRVCRYFPAHDQRPDGHHQFGGP